MSNPFATHLPLEHAFARRVRFAAEIVDAVTLEPVTRGVSVRTTGLNRGPITNCDGFFVWLEEGNLQPQEVIVDASASPYENVTVPAPVLPARRVRIELSPRYSYPFPAGVSVLRGTLVEDSVGTPTPVSGAELWLQWIDDTAAGTTWVDAPTHSHSNAKGDFAALLRLAPKQVPRPSAAGGLSARLRVRRGATTRTSSEFSLREGRVTDGLPPFAWSGLVP